MKTRRGSLEFADFGLDKKWVVDWIDHSYMDFILEENVIDFVLLSTFEWNFIQGHWYMHTFNFEGRIGRHHIPPTKVVIPRRSLTLTQVKTLEVLHLIYGKNSPYCKRKYEVLDE